MRDKKHLIKHSEGLEKKAKELLSLALKGRDMRNATLEQILPLLWHGAVDQTITSLENIDPQQVKDLSKVKEFIGYLRRNRHAIPVYEIRKRLGMKNSSFLKNWIWVIGLVWKVICSGQKRMS